ncbi:hypothetical protein, partial [Mycolicibacterium conceptionense]|uniref:hypothetical protein n=1 Tax=Mycolicibacterium conceptionense TaxID=451644 RepID=UPI001042006B
MTAETLHSYLGRVTDQNLLRPGMLRDLSKGRGFATTLSTLTGYSKRHLVFSLPELRTPASLRAYPQLAGEVSSCAGKRPACQQCVAARLGTDDCVTVFASHEQLICPTHSRWLGNGSLKCPRPHQFSIAACPEIIAANLQHKRIISRWGRGPTHASFLDAVTCLSRWSRWPVVMTASDIRGRWERLDITDESPPLSPAEIAAWYPNAVSLTRVILAQRREIKTARGMTRNIATASVERLRREVVEGLATSGAFDPYRYAITSDRIEPDSEVEAPAPPRPGG